MTCHRLRNALYFTTALIDAFMNGLQRLVPGYFGILARTYLAINQLRYHAVFPGMVYKGDERPKASCFSLF